MQRRTRFVPALAATVVATGLLAAPVASATASQANGTVTTDFASSFEAADPQPTWSDAVEEVDGEKKTGGVTGQPTSGIPGSVMDKVVAVTASAENLPNEGVAQLVDGDANSKWLAFSATGWAQVQLSEPIAVVRYALTSANDAPERDPKDWKLQGSQDGITWVDVDQQIAQDFADRFTTNDYQFSNTTAYLYYRLDITANHSGGLIQLAELQLSNGDTTPPPVTDMRSHIGSGPAAGPTIKPNVGFTGFSAFEYSGSHVGEGHGFSYNKVFDVDVRVNAESELSYRIFPQMIGNDLGYASTYAALDLAFTDGTYLSELHAKDQHGFELSPQSQGASKSLYANQWNHKESELGKVAKGKTIDRILVAYDNPDGHGQFKGWIDDVVIKTGKDEPTHSHLSDYVITNRGTNSSGAFSRGNNIPATAVPHGFNFWTPVTNGATTSWLYEYAAANNNASNLPTLQALALSHETSPWMGDRQTFQVMPSDATGVPGSSRAGRALPFRHENEVAKPHYYGVTFENGIKAEMTPTDHAAMLRFTFTGGSSNLALDNVTNDGGLTIDQANGVVTGFSDVRSGLSNGATRMYVYATFDKPVVGSGMLGGPRPNVAGYVKFDTSGADKAVTMRVATSLISIDQAKKNLELEISAGDGFEAVRDRAQRLWDDKLDVIKVEGASHDQLSTLYSNLYRLFLYPNSGHENTGTNAAPIWKHTVQSSTDTPPSGPTQTGAPIVGGKVYVNNGFWDTYRTTWAGYSLLSPTMAGELVDGFVQQYKDGGWISRWSSPGYANLMTGTSSDVAFADAYMKGIRNFDVKAAYDAAVKNATVRPPGSAVNSNVGRKGLENSIFLGWTPSTVSEGVSWALEGYINDFGIANMAKSLSEDRSLPRAERERYGEEADYFRNRALSYVNMFDPAIGFFQGRAADGTWKSTPDKYDPRVWGHDHDYTETDGWNFAFHVPFDGQGLANLYGGRDALADKLDTFFATPETATFTGSYGGVIHEMVEARDVRMGQWGFSNQVSHHIPFMYTYAGQPWKTQEKVREVLSRMYVGSEIGQGYAGDEDNGETSAWYLLNSLGLYPLQMGSENYVIGSPLFTKATVQLDNGKKIVVNAPNNNAKNVYVKSLRVNGKNHDQAYISHHQLATGAVLDFEMSPSPTKWGTKNDALPVSLSDGKDVAQPVGDATGLGVGAATASGGNPTLLFDNSSATESITTGPAPWVQFSFAAGRSAKARQYTLTSSAAPGADPTAWVLKGSRDGQRWKVLDERSGQSFAWRQQTRAFTIDDPGSYAHYRVEITGGGGALAEVELLAPPAAPLTDEESVAAYFDSLNLGDVTAVTQNLLIPDGSLHGVQATWTSSDPALITHAGKLVRRPALGEPDATATLTGTATKGTATHTEAIEVTVKAWTTEEMQYGAGVDLQTSFDDGQLQPFGNARLESVDVAEFCCGIGGMETVRGTASEAGGSPALLFSGRAEAADAHATSAAFDGAGIWVKPSTTLSYSVWPQSSGGGQVTPTSRNVAVEVLFTDGTYLRDTAAADQHGNSIHPRSQGGVLTFDKWNSVIVNVGAVAADKQVDRVVFSFDSGDLTGSFRGFVDDVKMEHQAS